MYTSVSKNFVILQSIGDRINTKLRNKDISLNLHIILEDI